ncbi:helix-hairpin-helix domain-containing protein [Lacticaseibacillus zhaodongensis]|uniref:helix-hairpin-helix domain-containing protein n=1 Tax=Lacticaseibacillus zhaodongensis TaxID=2668065 RepID=UPI001E3086BF|nr:helix-hairpin-helix domain-containing protein [Lacticaseibacillus zhaodongensis]
MEEKLDWLKENWRVAAVVAIGIVIVGLYFWHGPAAGAGASSISSSSFSSESTASKKQESSGSNSNSSSRSSGYVYIAGAVKHPGLYHVDAGTRWADVVQAAGGLTKDAEVSSVNLAKVAKDQENLAIPVHGAQNAAPPATSTAATTSGSATTGAAVASGSPALIDLNSATPEQLQTISGVGPKRAQDIIDYRDQKGGYKAVADLKNVSGIGDKIFADIQPHVTVGP